MEEEGEKGPGLEMYLHEDRSILLMYHGGSSGY